MYNLKDINNILESKKNCIKTIGDKVCTKVKSGNFFIDVNDITTFQSLEYLVSISDSECVTNLLIDAIQDICDDCISDEVEETVVTGCVENAIISEAGECLVTESNQNIISE